MSIFDEGDTSQDRFSRQEVKMMAEKMRNFVKETDMHSLKVAGTKFNENNYLSFVVNTILHFATSNEQFVRQLGLGTDDSFIRELRAAMITKFLLNELGERPFKREL